MEEIIKIFMKNYEMTRQEAKDYFYEMQSLVMEAVQCGDIWEVDEILADYGLEPDYVMDVIGL